MRFLFCLAAAALASASDTFSISVFAPNTTLHKAVLHANSLGLFTGLKGPSTYCPLTPPSECPPVAGTLVYRKMVAMAALVPGGQRTYIQSDGKVRYTMPHSSRMPEGAIINAWLRKKLTSNSPAPREVLDFNDGRGHSGTTLCRNHKSTLVPGDFELYAKTAAFNRANCTDIVGLVLTKSEEDIGAWEYT